MPHYLIERMIPGVNKVSPEQIKAISIKSNVVPSEMQRDETSIQ